MTIITSLDALEEPFRSKARGILSDAVERRAYFVVTETMRTYERQQALFAAGASRTMRSNHLIGKAIDVAPVVLYSEGRVERIGLSEEEKKLAAWVVLGELCEKWGVGWGGSRRGKWADYEDYPHLEERA